MTTANSKNCVACGESMPAGAYVCKGCKEHQVPWRNEVRYWATVAGFITLVFSGFAFVGGTARSSLDHYFPPELMVLDFDTFHDITFVNSSNQFVFVRYLRVTAPYPGPHKQLSWAPRWDINISIDPSKSAPVNLAKVAENQFRGLEKNIFGRVPGAYAQKLSTPEKQEIFSYKRHDDYVPVFLKKDGTEHSHLHKDIGKVITEFPCTAEVGYIYLQSQSERITSIPCVGVIKIAR